MKIKLLILALIISVTTNVVVLCSIPHPFQDTTKLRQALVMGWGIRGLAEAKAIDATQFKQYCVAGDNFDSCQAAVKSIIETVRDKYKGKNG